VRGLIIAGVLVASASLAGCSTVGGGSTVNGDALLKILTDPNCAHDDKISFVTGAGGIPRAYRAAPSGIARGRPSS
jgi:hypothetical protein